MNKRLEAVVADIVEGVRGALTKHGGVRVIENNFKLASAVVANAATTAG
jgi:hypothetical protein